MRFIKSSAGRTFGMQRHSPCVRRRIASLAVATAIGLPAMLTPFASQAQDTIKIGLPAPLTGSYQTAGTDIVDGAKLAAARINAAGGVLGRKIELVPQDDACNPDTAASAAAQLVAAGVVAVVGGYCSSAALPELDVLHRRAIPYVLSASTSPALTDHGWHEAFRTIGRADKQGVFASTLIKDLLHAKRAAVINDGTTYAQGLAQSTVAALKRDGVMVVYDGALTPGQLDYHDVTDAVAETTPDVLYFTGYYTEAVVLAKDLRDQGQKIKYFMGNGTADPSLIAKGGAAVEGMIITTSPLPQFIGTESGRRFVKAYEHAFQRAPGPYSIYAYDAIGVTVQAIKNGHSTKPEDIAEALHALKNFNGATGAIAFDGRGDRTRPGFMAVTVRNGRFEPYGALDNSGRWTMAK